MKKITIGVDDGHGMATAGKRTPDGYKENEFNHYTKEYLIEELHYNGFDTVDCSPTRNDNSLQNRCDIANKGNADLFVSIHFNAYTGKWQIKATGIESYHFPNSVEGKKAAACIQNELLTGTKQTNRGVKSANFYVLKYTKMPAVLVECGFMDNKHEAELMKSIEFRKECSMEICKGICFYFGSTYKNKNKLENDFEGSKIYYVQTGAFTNYDNALKMVKSLKQKGIDSIIKK